MTKYKFSIWWLFVLVPFASVFTSILIFFLIYVGVRNLDNFLKLINVSNFKPISFFIYGLGAFIAFLLLYFLLKKKALSLTDIGFNNKITNKMIIFSITAVIIAFVLYSPIQYLMNFLNIPMYWNYSDLPVHVSTPTDMIITFLGAVVLGVIGEDSIFRGYLLSMFRERLSLKCTVILSVFLFTLIHLALGPGITIYIIPWAFISCYLFIKFESVYPCILFHFLNNFVAYIIFPVLLS